MTTDPQRPTSQFVAIDFKRTNMEALVETWEGLQLREE